MIECAKCATVLPNQEDHCPNCGSLEKNRLINIVDLLGLNEEVSLSITQHNSIWNLLPKSLDFFVKHLDDENFREYGTGFSIQVMVNTAILIEGLITDCIEEGIEKITKAGGNLSDKERDLDHASWVVKKNSIRDILKIELNDLPKFDEIETLFLIRNNVSHGRSYKIAHNTTFRNQSKPHSSEIEIKNRSYKRVYNKLEILGLVPQLQQSSMLNIGALFRPQVAKFFYNAAIDFLKNWIDLPQIKEFPQIQKDFKNAFPEIR
jgi:hypothetical protein